jgi:hypothetical protein
MIKTPKLAKHGNFLLTHGFFDELESFERLLPHLGRELPTHALIAVLLAHLGGQNRTTTTDGEMIGASNLQINLCCLVLEKV